MYSEWIASPLGVTRVGISVVTGTPSLVVSPSVSPSVVSAVVSEEGDKSLLQTGYDRSYSCNKANTYNYTCTTNRYMYYKQIHVLQTDTCTTNRYMYMYLYHFPYITHHTHVPYCELIQITHN